MLQMKRLYNHRVAPVIENQQAGSIPPETTSVQYNFISPGPAFTRSRFKDDPKTMMHFSEFEGYEQFSPFSYVMMDKISQT